MRKCKSKYHTGGRNVPVDQFVGTSSCCNACVKLSQERYRQSDKGKMRWEKYYTEHGDTIRARANLQHHTRNQNADYLFISAKRRAKRSNIPFSISAADIVIPEYCPVLGIPLKFSLGGRTNNTPSVDRIDNSLGYVPGNVAVISWRANFMKRDLSAIEITQLYKYMTGTNPNE